MSRPAEYSFIRYLAAKKSVDDRALNRRVLEALAQAVAARSAGTPLRVLEIGCGIGAMAERLVKWGILKDADYTGIDLEPACVAEALRRLQRFAELNDLAVETETERLKLTGPDLNLSLTFEAADCFAFADRETGRSTWDLLVAHAFLDLVDLGEALPRLLALLRPGGWFYFPLNFDGATVFQPVIEPAWEGRLMDLYHQTMIRRGLGGKVSDGSTTGRRLFAALKAAGAEVLAAGGSDWVVFPEAGGYPEDEAYFLHFIIHTIQEALADYPGWDRRALEAWIDRRHAQVEAGELVYLAHQLDFFGRVL
ncbi:MAG: class I SAM-dependent methyltransferase [Deltaproteobacteria bacterium]|nr:class I SAM-dependent methyltransferase [Deltaproteobacteria bacterium]